MRGGFTLLEILPAMVLLAGCLAVGYHFVHLAFIARETRVRHRLRQEAWPVVEHWWNRNGDDAVVSVRQDFGRWTVYAMHTENWLPGDFAGDPGGTAILWRNRVGQGMGRGAFRIVEYKDAGAGTWNLWSCGLTATLGKGFP